MQVHSTDYPVSIGLFLIHNRPGLMSTIQSWLDTYVDSNDYMFGGGSSWINGVHYPGRVYFKNKNDAMAFRLKFSQDLVECSQP